MILQTVKLRLLFLFRLSVSNCSVTSWAFSLSLLAASLLFPPIAASFFSVFFLLVVEVSGLAHFAVTLFHFILLFWNQVFTCASFKPRICDNFARFVESKYLCSEKVFSKTCNWRTVKTVRDLFPLGVRRAGFNLKNTGRGWCMISELNGRSTIKKSVKTYWYTK